MTYVALALVPPMLLWLLFRIIMRLKERRDKAVPKDLPTFTKVWGYPTLFVGYALDFMVNVMHCTVVFLEMPKESTVSARVKRHTNDTTVPPSYLKYIVLYRRAVACLMRDRLLKPYDPSGGHD